MVVVANMHLKFMWQYFCEILRILERHSLRRLTEHELCLPHICRIFINVDASVKIFVRRTFSDFIDNSHIKVITVYFCM